MNTVGIFCGSSAGSSPVYLAAARSAGQWLAQNGIHIVYGGGRVGLMGAVADAALAQGGQVTGVIPRALKAREIAHTGLSELHVVDDMHQRKTLMAELSDGFIALPGGAGTAEEIFEQWTWAQLGIHHKPCAFLNVNDFYQPLREMIQQMVSEGFMKPDYADMVFFSDNTRAIADYFHTYTPPVSKWTASDGIRYA
ncbi:TIGR00730 family protein [Escherichia coli]|uniref:LOG family protein n=1 Tax=Escherichia coli TaxID=562 RepID=UPI000B93BBD2|nr:TIGR00730 family Rossman fold protein [Escherichia coli]OXZ49395.1 TIGR00730 family protein [Escherichia coli]OXZ81328.1 TIGR00730 family protein [Escherichia coli]